MLWAGRKKRWQFGLLCHLHLGLRFLSSSPDLQEERLDLLVEARFPGGRVMPAVHHFLAAFLQSEPCKRLLPRSGVGTKGICFGRGDLASWLCSTLLLGRQGSEV